MCIKQSVHMARKPKQNLGEHRYGKVYLFPSAAVLYLQFQNPAALFASHLQAGGFGGNGQLSELSAGF